MATRFIGKNIKKKIVRPMKNSVKHKNYVAVMEHKVAATAPTVVQKEDETHKKENKKQKKSKDMVTENKLSQMEEIIGATTPKTKVKIEKADKGLFERTEESTVLLTEDNKMLLND